MKELLLESTIIQGIVTLVLVLVVAYVEVSGGEVSEVVTQALFAVIGFWFGSKAQIAARLSARTRGE